VLCEGLEDLLLDPLPLPLLPPRLLRLEPVPRELEEELELFGEEVLEEPRVPVGEDEDEDEPG